MKKRICEKCVFYMPYTPRGPVDLSETMHFCTRFAVPRERPKMDWDRAEYQYDVVGLDDCFRLNEYQDCEVYRRKAFWRRWFSKVRNTNKIKRIIHGFSKVDNQG